MSGRTAGLSPRGPRGGHYLADRGLAADLVTAAELSRQDLVLEVGAGSGRLTEQIARRAGRVIAIEADPRAAARLRSRFGPQSNVTVVAGDALEVPLPGRRFRVVANPPFFMIGALLHRLLDESRPLLGRADLVLEWRAAIGLCTLTPPSRRSLRWQPWFEFVLVRRLAADRFVPPPSGDAAYVSIRRRAEPLLPPSEAAAFRRFLARQASGEDVWDLVHRFRR